MYIFRFRLLTSFDSIYADLDVECLRSHDSLFDEFNTSSKPKPVAIFGRMGSNPKFRDSIPNAWMASSQGHPFFWLPLSYVLDHSRYDMGLVEALTGPIALREQVTIYQNTPPAALCREVQESLLSTAYLGCNSDQLEHQVILLNKTLIYPYSWSRDGRAFKYVCEFNEFDFNPRRCQELLRTAKHESYAITYWSHSWTSTGHNNKHLQNAS
jgi:inositol phosphorylceramide mannosyltransferase catalytic subunit